MCLVELALIILGTVTLWRNRFSLFGFRVVTGGAATVIGLLLLAPPAITMGIGFKQGFEYGKKHGKMADMKALMEMSAQLAGVELIMLGFALLLSLVIFCCYCVKPGREYQDEDDWKTPPGQQGRGVTQLRSDEFFPRW